MAFKQYRISDLITILEETKKTYGDLPVELMKDEEGNGSNPIGDVIPEEEQPIKPISVEQMDSGVKTLFLWPCNR